MPLSISLILSAQAHTLSISFCVEFWWVIVVVVDDRKFMWNPKQKLSSTHCSASLSLSLSHTHSLANTKHYQTRQMLMLLLRALTHSSNTSFTCVCVYHACVLCIVRGRERGKDGMVWGGVYLLGVNPTTRHVNAEMAILPSPFFFNPTPDIIFSLFCILHLYFVRLWPDPFKEKEESLHFKSSPAANKIVKIWFWFRSGTLLPTQGQEGGGKNDFWLLVKREKWYFEKFCERTKNKVRASEVTLKIWKLSNHLNSVSRSVSD